MTSLPLIRAGELLPRRRTVAIMTAFNEGDVIHHAIGALIEEGIEVYLIDNCSTDDTVEQAAHWLGKGLLHIERFPDDAGFDERNRSEYVWRDILTRVEQVSAKLGAAWYLFVNADEFRESPWADLTLSEAVAFVDSLGYSAINFELYDFQPVDDDFVPGSDVRDHILRYERGETFNVLQIKAWRAPAGKPAQVVATGGHDIDFPGRRLFPIPFILRHYGLRGETHGRRKVFGERLPRFAAEEKAWGWHVQYDAYARGERRFLRKPEDLIPYDGDRVRAELLARASRAVLLTDALRGFDPAARAPHADAVAEWSERVLGRGQRGPALGAALGRAADVARRSATADAHATGEVITAARMLASENAATGDLVAAHRFGEVVAELGDAALAAALDARAFVIVAFLDEVVEHPDLLRAYAAEFGASDDATLVVYGPDVPFDDVGERLVPVLEALGLDGEDSPDMLALGLPATEGEILLGRRAGAVLSAAERGPLCGIRRFGADDCQQLRSLAEGIADAAGARTGD